MCLHAPRCSLLCCLREHPLQPAGAPAPAAVVPLPLSWHGLHCRIRQHPLQVALAVLLQRLQAPLTAWLQQLQAPLTASLQQLQASLTALPQRLQAPLTALPQRPPVPLQVPFVALLQRLHVFSTCTALRLKLPSCRGYPQRLLRLFLAAPLAIQLQQGRLTWL